MHGQSISSARMPEYPKAIAHGEITVGAVMVIFSYCEISGELPCWPAPAAIGNGTLPYQKHCGGVHSFSKFLTSPRVFDEPSGICAKIACGAALCIIIFKKLR